MVEKRDIAIAIILSIVTCGIYGIIWFIKMTDDVAKVSEKPEISGGKAFLLALVTCGIYMFFWSYQMGKELYEAGLKAGKQVSDNSLIYIILGIFGLWIVDYCLIQNELNTNYAAINGQN